MLQENWWNAIYTKVLDLNTSQSTIYCHLKKIGKVWKLGIWVPHTLSEKNKEYCVSVVTSLLSRPRNNLFLKNIITSDKHLSFMTMFNRKGNELNSMILCSLPQRQKRKKSYAVCMVGSPWYYYLSWVFKLQSDTQGRFILSTTAMCAWKSSKKIHSICH